MLFKITKLAICMIASHLLTGPLFSQSLVFQKTGQKLTLPRGERYASFSYKFTNKGPDVIKINKVELSCGCSSYELAKTIFEPGETGIINIKMDTIDKGDQGYVVVAIETDEKEGEYMLRGHVTIPTHVTVTPLMLRWQADGEMGEQRLQVTFDAPDNGNTGDIKFNAENLFVRDGHFAVRIEPTQDSNRFYVHVRPKSGMKCADIITVSPNPENSYENIEIIAYIGENRKKL